MDFNNQLDPSTITDVETAKLALRWAVEKIHALSDDNARLKEDNRNKTNIARSLTQQGEQKDEVLKKWQTTIKTWEENWKTQTALEADLKGKLREQILNEETANWRQARAQLENEIRALKTELAAKEAEIGKLKLYAIDEIRKAAEVKDAETQAIISSSQDALAQRENAMRVKYGRFEKELLESRRVSTEQEELALKERYEIKMREFSRLYQAREAQLEEFRKNLEDDYLAKADALTAERTAKLNEERQELAAKAEAAGAETEKDAARRFKGIEEGFKGRCETMRAEFEARERAFAAEKDSETTILKEAHQKELSELRNRLRQYIRQREQDYVDLRLVMEDQMLELVKKHDEAGAAAYQEAARETREKWKKLAIANQKKLDAAVNDLNARWEADWSKRETESLAQREALLCAERERLADEFKVKEETLRKILIGEQNEWTVKQTGELEKAKRDIEKAHEERLELIKKSINEAYILKERSLEERLAAARDKLRAEWLAREEEWAVEKDRSIFEEKEKLKNEFAKFEDELKQKYARRELELEGKLKVETAGLEKKFSARLQTEKQRLIAGFDGNKRELACKEAELEKNLENSIKRQEEEFSARRLQLAEEMRRNLSDKEKAFGEKLARKEAELVKDYEARVARLAEEKSAAESDIARKEAGISAKEEDLRADFNNRLKEEKIKIEESYKSHESHLKAREAEMENLKIKLYQELLQKENEQLERLARAKEEMSRAMNERRSVPDKEYEQRLAGLQAKEVSLQQEFNKKTEELLKNFNNQKETELDRLGTEFAARKAELEKNYADKLAKTEADCAAKVKELLASQEKDMQRRREDIETLHKHQAAELERKYTEMARAFNSDFERQREAWEAQRAEILEREKQTLRTETEKRAAALNRKLEEETEKNENYKAKLEEDFNKRRRELEQEHYKKLEESRSALEKMRKELEASLGAKFNEMEAEQNRLTMWVFQKEEDYVKKYKNKELELLQQSQTREKALAESYEKRIKELEAKLAAGK